MKCAFLLFLGFFSGVSEAALPQWSPVELVEIPTDTCLPLEGAEPRQLCVSESKKDLVDFTHFFEVKMKEGKPEKRMILQLEDTSSVCSRPTLSVSRFYGFESRDLDQDGRSDAVILVRAGKLKQRAIYKSPCEQQPIGTAIYEVSFLNKEGGLASYEPSYAVLKRLQSLSALVAE